MATWSDPETELVATDTYRIPLPLPLDGLRAVNVYLLVDPAGLTLVDAGWALPEAERALHEAIAGLGFEVGDVDRVLVTHAHRDHYTLATWLRQKHSIRVGLGVDETFSVRQLGLPSARIPQLDMLPVAGAAQLAEKLAGNGARTHDPALWRDPDDWIEERQVFSLGNSRRLRAIHTPGHTRGHVVYEELATGSLFTGDHVLPHITPSIAYEQCPLERPLWRYIRSLRRMLLEADGPYYPGHGPVGTSLHTRVQELLEHHQQRLRDSLTLTSRHARSAASVAGMMSWTSRKRRFAELDEQNQMLAVLETDAHLGLLADLGFLTREPSADAVRYTRCLDDPSEVRI